MLPTPGVWSDVVKGLVYSYLLGPVDLSTYIYDKQPATLSRVGPKVPGDNLRSITELPLVDPCGLQLLKGDSYDGLILVVRFVGEEKRRPEGTR
jgi:hypothetical protein